MPNTGRPSQDCHLCRQRRVKCDLARPACQRCVKYGAECPGYREPHELVFRNANPLTVKKRKKKPSSASAEDQDASSPRTEQGSSRSITPTSQTSSVTTVADDKEVFLPLLSDNPLGSLTKMPRTVTEHWTNHSVPILLNVYSTLAFLHNIYRIDRRNGPLMWAAHLFTRTYVTNIRQPVAVHRESALETQQELGAYLGKTLNAVNSALREPGGAYRDDVLATVWILASYELLIGSLGRVGPMSAWHLHTRGLYSILKTRGVHILLTAQGRTAFWPCYNMIQIQALVSNTECPPESDQWLFVIRNSLFEGEAYTFHVAVFITRVTSVQASIRKVLHERDYIAGEQQYESLVYQLVSAELEMRDYTWTSMNKNDHIDVYMRSLYESAVIKGYSYIMLLANFLTHHEACTLPLNDLMAQRSQCLSIIRTAAQSIVDSIPVALYRLTNGKEISPRALFDGLKMVWPLTVVHIVPATTPEQKAKAESALAFIGKEIGVRQALHTRPVKVPLPLEARLPRHLGPTDDATPAFIDL